MAETMGAAFGSLDPAQATELSELLELEARWENLRMTPPGSKAGGLGARGLLGVQRAYDAFRSKLVAYNGRYTPAHAPERLLNTPARLSAWCRAMRQVYLCLEHDPDAQCPVHLLEKAYRWAERMSVRLNRDRASRPAPPRTVRAVIQDLGALVRWCEGLAGADTARAGPEATPPA
jgi:hypothetical protein